MSVSLYKFAVPALKWSLQSDYHQQCNLLTNRVIFRCEWYPLKYSLTNEISFFFSFPYYEFNHMSTFLFHT